MTIDIEKAKQALATLEREKQEQQDRLRLATQAKQQLENDIVHRTQLPYKHQFSF